MNHTEPHGKPHRTTPVEDVDEIISRESAHDLMIKHAIYLVKGGAEYKQIESYLAHHAYGIMDLEQQVDLVTDIKEITEKAFSVVWGSKTNVAEEVKEWVRTTEGSFQTRQCYQDLSIVTKREKKTAYMVMLRMVEEGYLEREGKQTGTFRKVETETEEMQFIEHEIFEYPIKLPFGLNDICSLYAKNICVIAGSKSSGKSAFCLNLAFANQHKHEVVYLNSEAGDEEWTTRLRKMGVNSKADLKFKAYPCHTNFHDKMNGSNKIYIVDFLEVHDNFFEVAKPIRLIHEKIQDGICFIALQKKGSERLGRGADFSMEKARLYLTLDYLESESDPCSRLTIVDAKASKIAQGAKGLSKRIKIIDGSRMEALDRDWRRL